MEAQGSPLLPLFLEQTEARMASETGHPPPRPSPPSQGLDPALITLIFRAGPSASAKPFL